ncbi:dihydroorotate dehydrogenase electron transfer subunit [Mesorhizobium microcysteis]|uniref:Dihydroorotate dehydrogenase electron transfer subunit n=1 Tax=Neoaquamicrobium microcysteis TaxID=2682781 RepID=A0A5D4GQQ5_9HYPH|nr:dihydroorotate dehydrogenase electron transfer subunit [Mesorhizobium microcysteis]TYR30687.1 dihydroorotate dehydrogenase electron transfer subunit [Mesorhizobium microcysteis]
MALHATTAAAISPANAPAVFERDLEVLSNEPVNGEYMRLVLRAPAALLQQCRAGQFFHLLCPVVGGERPYLRRPMSIYGFYPEREELHFLYKVTGEGTRALFHLGPDDRLNVLGPLGQGFSIEDDWNHLVLVARGVGLATLAPLALEAKRLGRKLTAICSARSPDVLMSIDYFRDLGADIVTVTDAENTAGVDNLERIIEELIADKGVDAFYTCGSNRLLRLLQNLGERHDIPGEIALEQQMACGLGMCHCCVRPFRKDGRQVNLRVCREGPVFDMQEAMPW